MSATGYGQYSHAIASLPHLSASSLRFNMEHIFNAPLYFVQGCIVIWQATYSLPWPSFERIFQGVVVGLISWAVLYVPKTKAERRLRRIERATHRKHTDRMSDKQSAASVLSSVSGVFNRH